MSSKAPGPNDRDPKGKIMLDQKRQLRRVNPPQIAPPLHEVQHTQEEIDSMLQLFSQFGGNYQELCKVTGSDHRLMEKDPPRDNTDFARGVLRGRWVVDNGH